MPTHYSLLITHHSSLITGENMPRKAGFGKNWWAQRWIGALEKLGWSSRLERGRSYARNGHVKSIEVIGGEIRARVQGSMPSPYRVTITLKPLNPEEWDRVLETLSSQAIFAAKLLAGEMPSDIEEAFQAEKVALFPSSSHDLVTYCSCPDLANPCKHVAAVHYVLSEEFDRDPFLLFALRGRSKEEVLAALRVRRAEATSGTDPVEPPVEMEVPEAEALPLEESLDHFWVPGEDLVPLLEPPGRRRVVTEAVLRILGQPAFSKEGDALLSTLAVAYEKVAMRARKAARSGGSPASDSSLNDLPGGDL
jgi:uncharacterized Zn finger protein